MSTITRTELVLPAAELGPENPLPPLRRTEPAASVSNVDELPADLAANLSYGRLDTVLPCRMQDGYGRDRTEQRLPALVLENERLRATVLPGLGGRLHSLLDKETGRDLVYRNPVFQPANLALRDAWFAGGVEWNLGSTGHTTLTCAPMFAAEAPGPGGEPVLRLWEWERTRDLPYQLDFWLPDGSRQLFVGVRIRNPHAHDVPVYWWSNTAVAQTAGTRVLAPAARAWHYGYSGRLELVDVADDLTYPARAQAAADYFFEVDGPPWIAAVDAAGYGLGQASTARLRGRKLFVWGESAGGRRWQEWLAPGMEGYLEIQAGLARTQLEHLRLPAGASWDWLESYGPVAADPEIAHGPDWPAALASVAAELPAAEELDRRWREWRAVADAAPGELLATGSGWGALETRRMLTELPGTPFPEDSLGAAQQPSLDLLDGVAPRADPAAEPPDTLVNRHWAELLEAVPDEGWLTWYHRGIARWAAGDRGGAKAAWHRSVEAEPNGWAWRNLAVAQDDPVRAAEYYRQALDLLPKLAPLAVEAVAAQLAAGDPGAAREMLEPWPAEGRFALLRARTSLALGDLEGAREVYERGFTVPGIREGETSLSDVWHAISAGPLPAEYDFRMKTGGRAG